MKDIVLVMAIMSMLLACKASYHSGENAIQKIDSVYNSYFTRMEYYLQHPKADTTGDVQRIRSYMNKVTQTTSSGDRSYFLGRMGYTEDDILKWRRWYTENRKKDILFWNDTTMEIEDRIKQ